MNIVSQPKVFEFAKEIGMETLALMDKIREWKLPVRSHMAELDPVMLDQIKSRLKEEVAARTDSGKRKKVVKKATSAASGSATAETASSAAKKPAAKKTATSAAKAAGPTKGTATKSASSKAGVAKSAAEGTSAAESAASGAKKVVVKKALAKTVIRRKTAEEEAAEAAEAAAVVAEVEFEEVIEAHALEPVVSTPELKAEPIAEIEEKVAPLEAAVEVAPAAFEDKVIPVGARAEVAPIAARPLASPAPAPVSSAPAPAVAAAAAAVPSGPGIVTGITPARKREVVMTASGPVSGVKSEAPRRNIVGRMDLSRVSPPQGSGPGSGGPQGSGPRPIGPVGSGGPGRGPMTRNLRTGFVAAAPVEIPEFDDADRKKFEERKRKFGSGPGAGPGGPGAATTKERELENVTFSATEFRKREMVFQPKKKKGLLNRESRKTEITKPRASKRVVRVNEKMKVSDLALELGLKAGQIVKVLMQNGMTATMSTDLDFDTIALIVPEFGFEAVNVHRTVDQLIDANAFGQMDAAPVHRAPVVTVMGHVDHGKTSLLDAIRKADVASREAGGITQHIGAYRVTTDNGHQITFIDTPGHEAFTAMRARGANATDIAIIVVAADDGVMPQTAEAINHAKAAEVPIIVAVNKIDKAGADPDKIKRQLTEFELVPEEWGGSTIFVNTSAVQKTGIAELLEQIYLLAEMEELSANPDRSATGVVIESRMEKGRGAVATLLVQDGTLKIGQSIVAGSIFGRVRSLMNDRGERVQEAGPSVPVEVLGLPDTPSAGDRFDVAVDEEAAQKIAEARRVKVDPATSIQTKVSLEDLFAKMKLGDVKELPIILKTDVAGSIEAIRGMFDKLGTSEVKIKVIHTAVGGINESDILLASTAKGIVVGFNVRPDGGASNAAKREGVEIKTYSIVYELMDDMKKAMTGLLAPTIVENQLGRAEVRNTFSVPKIGMIAGSFVADGKITRQAQVRLVRDGKIIYTGKIGSLKRFKDDAREVAAGFECGIGIENYNDLKVGDVIEAFLTESITREL